MTDPDLAAITENLLSETVSELSLRSTDMPQGVRDGIDDFSTAARDSLAAGRQLQADFDELDKKADLIPGPGLQRLRGEALSEARKRVDEADHRAERAYETLKSELTSAALPKLDPRREALARDELALALGNAQGDHAVARSVRVAQNGSREVVAALFSPYGRTLLQARGVDGRTLEEGLDNARTVAAAVAVDRADDPGEILAGSALRRLAKLGAVKGVAGDPARRLIRNAGG